MLRRLGVAYLKIFNCVGRVSAPSLLRFPLILFNRDLQSTACTQGAARCHEQQQAQENFHGAIHGVAAAGKRDGDALRKIAERQEAAPREAILFVACDEHAHKDQRHQRQHQPSRTLTWHRLCEPAEPQQQPQAESGQGNQRQTASGKSQTHAVRNRLATSATRAPSAWQSCFSVSSSLRSLLRPAWWLGPYGV